MRQEQVHHGVRILGREVLRDLPQAGRIALFRGRLRNHLLPVRAHGATQGRDETGRRHAAGHQCIAKVRQHHAGHDGPKVRRALLRRRQLGRPTVRPVDHADPGVGPGLRRREFDGFGAMSSELRTRVLERACGTATARGVDAHHRIAGLDEALVELDGHRRLVVEVGRAADRSGVVAVDAQDDREPSRCLRQQRAVAQPDAVGGREVAGNALRPERCGRPLRGEIERPRRRQARVGIQQDILPMCCERRDERRGERDGGDDELLHGSCTQGLAGSAAGGDVRALLRHRQSFTRQTLWAGKYTRADAVL
ncbi:hypothetical protein D3C85_1084940 [compost metagenome]